MNANKIMNRKDFLDALTINGYLNSKKLFPDFPEGPRSLRDFRIMRVENGYEIFTCYSSLFRMLSVTIHSITEEGFIIKLNSIYFQYKAYLESILGKSIIYRRYWYYLEGKEYPLERGQEYRYDEKTKNYYLHNQEPIVKEGEWNRSAKRKVDRFLKDLRQAQNFYKQFLPKDVTLERMVVYDDLKELYNSYSKHGKEALADPSIVSLSIDRWKLEIYKDLGALTITQRRVDP
jgi:hypothetical protein